MRFTRVLIATVSSVALALPAASVATASQDVDAKRSREIDARIVNVTDTQLQLRAHVKGDYDRKITHLMKKNCAKCDFKQVAKKRTDSTGHVRYNVGAPRTGRWYYKVRTPETRRFRTSYSATFYTYRL